MKRVFLILVIFFAFIFLARDIFAQTPTPEPEPGRIGGRCKSVDFSTIEKELSTKTEEVGELGADCINFLGFNIFCLSDITNKAINSVKNIILTEDLMEAFNQAGVCLEGRPSTVDITSPDCRCIDEAIIDREGFLCHTYIQREGIVSGGELLENKEYTHCLDCFANGGFWSGIGCIYFKDWQTFFSKNIFGILIGLAGGVALLCIIYSAVILQTSSGNPEKIKKAQQQLTSCIIGLMLIIFSIFILRVIGVDILRIPGLSSR